MTVAAIQDLAGWLVVRFGILPEEIELFFVRDENAFFGQVHVVIESDRAGVRSCCAVAEPGKLGMEVSLEAAHSLVDGWLLVLALQVGVADGALTVRNPAQRYAAAVFLVAGNTKLCAGGRDLLFVMDGARMTGLAGLIGHGAERRVAVPEPLPGLEGFL